MAASSSTRPIKLVSVAGMVCKRPGRKLHVISHLDEHRAAARLTAVDLPRSDIDLARSATRKAIDTVTHGSASGRHRRGWRYLGHGLPGRRPGRPVGPCTRVAAQRTGRLRPAARGAAAAWPVIDPSAATSRTGGDGRQKGAQARPNFGRQRHLAFMRSHVLSRPWPAVVARVVYGLASRLWVSSLLCLCLYLLRGRPLHTLLHERARLACTCSMLA